MIAYGCHLVSLDAGPARRYNPRHDEVDARDTANYAPGPLRCGAGA